MHLDCSIADDPPIVKAAVKPRPPGPNVGLQDVTLGAFPAPVSFTSLLLHLFAQSVQAPLYPQNVGLQDPATYLPFW